jgi:hypothetical protein
VRKNIPYTEYLFEVKARVCSLCSQSNEDGSCSLSGTQKCTVERHLPRIVEVANTVQGNDAAEYIGAFRMHVCKDCRENGEHSCTDRDSDACGLDTYFPLVLEAIEAVERRHPF